MIHMAELKILIESFIVSILALACSTSPTGRKQLTFMPEAQMSKMGLQSFSALKQKTPIETDAATNRYVKCITDPILKAAGSVEGVKSWEVVVFKDESANAFALPGGRIGVHTGLIKIAKTPDQLAAVIGHEVGHVMAKHGNERVSQGLAAQGLQMGAALVLSPDGQMDQKSQIILSGIGVGAQFGVLLPFSRTHETEADIIGLELMAKAGFNPQDSVELWKNMATASGGKQTPEFLSTHPSNKTRINSLAGHIPKVQAYYDDVKAKGRLPSCRL
jgi:predicted Zn-dependent protease